MDVGIAQDIYDYKEIINKFNSENNMNTFVLAPFTMKITLNTKEINLSICVLSTEKLTIASREKV